VSRRGAPAVAVVSVDRPRALRAQRTEASEQGRESARRVAATAGLALLLAGSLAAAGWAVQSDAFRLRQVTIEGASPSVRLAIQDVVAPGCTEREAAKLQCPVAGPNLLLLSTIDVERQIAERLPLVKSARVKATLPGSLHINVTERRPEAAWLVGTETYRVADDGTILDRIARDQREGLKVSIGQVAGEPLKPGDRVDIDIIKAAELLQERLPTEFGIAPRRIEYSPADGLAVIGDQELIAMFGPPRDLNLKMAELQRILQLAQDKKAPLAFVDLRYKTPYFRTR